MDTTNTLLRANVRFALRSDLCLVGSTVLSIYAFGIWSFGAFGVANVGALTCVTDEVRFVCIDLNGSKFKCHLDECGAAYALKSASFVEVLC